MPCCCGVSQVVQPAVVEDGVFQWYQYHVAMVVLQWESFHIYGVLHVHVRLLPARDVGF